MSRAQLVSLALVALLAGPLVVACTQGKGAGSVCGVLDVADCWAGPFNLHPDFFAAIPDTTSRAMQLRIQNGGDYETYSDGIAILIDDIGAIRGDPTSTKQPRPSLLGQTLVVGLPAGVTPPGVPLQAVASSTLVHAALYLDKTCRVENDALYAMSAVTLNADGTCSADDGGEPATSCEAPATIASPSADASTPDAAPTSTDASLTGSPGGDAGSAGLASSPDTASCSAFSEPDASTVAAAPGTSTILFNSLFDGNEDARNADERLTDVQFDLYFADPRDVCPGGVGPPPRCRAHLVGYGRFYFQRGQPAQPFP